MSAARALRLAASVDRVSAHVLGEALVSAARRACSSCSQQRVHEQPGQGIEGTLDGLRVLVGSRAFLRAAGAPHMEIASSFLSTTRGSGEAHAWSLLTVTSPA